MEIPGKLPINKRTDNIPKQYKDIASGMERQFLEYMLERMKATVSDEEMSTSQNYYNSLQTSEQAKIMAEQEEGTGIKEMILNQIYPKNRRIGLGQYAKENKL